MFEKRIVIDCRGHLLGRLSSVVAKELLCGQRIVLVRTEEMNVSGSLFRNKLKYHDFLQKRTNTNPKRGPFHHRAPSMMVWRCIRGMLPHKSPRGAAAMGRLKLFEGIPPPYDKLKRVVVPTALKVTRLKPGRKVTVLSELAQQVGWKYQDTIKKLEDKRKVRAASWYGRKKILNKLKTKVLNESKEALKKSTAVLEASGY